MSDGVVQHRIFVATEFMTRRRVVVQVDRYPLSVSRMGNTMKAGIGFLDSWIPGIASINSALVLFHSTPVKKQITVAVHSLQMPISPKYRLSQFHFLPARPVHEQNKRDIRIRGHFFLSPAFSRLFFGFLHLDEVRARCAIDPFPMPPRIEHRNAIDHGLRATVNE